MDLATERVRRALLTLLRAGLWNRPIDETACFPMSEREWRALFELARRQTVTGVVFQGLQWLPDEWLPAPAVLVRWMAGVDAVERRNREMNGVLAALSADFRALGFDPVLQKGQGVAAYYERPLLRECGDIDLCFCDRQTSERAAEYMRRQGAVIQRMSDGALFYRWKGFEVEHHVRLLDLHNPFLQRDAIRLIHEKGCVEVALPERSGASIAVPAPFVNLLLLDLHVLKHALGRGIGLRQLCDLARACHRLHEAIDADEMSALCHRWGLDRWNRLLHAFLVDCLGLEAASLPYAERASDAGPLLEIVWRGGNFGHYPTGRGRARRSRAGRKLATARSFCGNLRFACRYAPKEAFWLFADLMKGQFR